VDVDVLAGTFARPIGTPYLKIWAPASIGRIATLCANGIGSRVVKVRPSTSIVAPLARLAVATATLS
jgi:hypothetical protein